MRLLLGVAMRGLVAGTAVFGAATAVIAGLNLRGLAVLWAVGLLTVAGREAGGRFLARWAR